MALYFYNPPEKDEDGKPFPPFVFEWSSTQYVVMAHRYWKQIVEPYIIKKHFDEFGRPELDEMGNQRCDMGRKSKWVLDEEMNAKLDAGEILKPDNGIHIDSQVYRDIQQSKYGKFLKHLVSEQTLRKAQRQNLQELRKAAADEYEVTKREIEEEKQQLLAIKKKMMDERAAIDELIREATEPGPEDVVPKKKPGRPKKFHKEAT